MIMFGRGMARPLPMMGGGAGLGWLGLIMTRWRDRTATRGSVRGCRAIQDSGRNLG
jgi:hypothetical protein